MQEFSKNFSNKKMKNNINKMNEEENLLKKIQIKKKIYRFNKSIIFT
jgi:hypothetical protein